MNWVAGAFEKITSYTREEYMANGGWLGVLHPDDIEQDAQDMETVLQNKRVVTEVRTFTKNQGIRWVRVYAHPVWDDKQNQITGIVGAVQDITEHKKVTEREASHQASLEKIVELGKYVTESKDLQTTYKRIWHAIRYDLKFDRLGIYLYDAENTSMVGTYGTNNHGEMVDKSNEIILLNNPTIETESFVTALKEEDGLYFTDQYDVAHNIQAGHIMFKVKDYAAVAAWSDNKPVAVLSVDNAFSQQPITDAQLESLRLFAGFVGLAIENSRLNDSLQYELTQQKHTEEKETNRRTMLEKVVLLGQEVTEVKNMKTTLERIWDGVHNVLGFDRLAVFLFDSERNSMDSMIGTDINGNRQDTSGISFSISETFKMVLDEPDGLFITHNYDTEYNIPEGHEMYGVKDFAAVAAWAGDKPIAVISVDQLVSGRLITDIQLEALRLFAGYAGLTLENSRLNETLQSKLDQQILAEEKESRHRAMLEKVVRLGQYVTEIQDLPTTLQMIWQSVRHDLDFDRPAIFLYDPMNNVTNGSYGTNRKGEMVEEWDNHISLDEYTIEPTALKNALLESNKNLITHNYGVENNIVDEHNIMYGVRDHGLVAAWAGDKPVAIISVDNLLTGRLLSEEKMDALRLFAGYAGLAIENSRLNEALQSELGQRQTLIDELETKNAELERFTYTVLHDLKSPLVTITGFLGYLEQDATSGNMERVKSGIDRISRAARKMQALLNDLLELSRVGRIMNAPDDIPFDEIVNEAIDHVRGQLNELGAIVESQAEYPVVHGDRLRLVEVVQNLIDNAVKYSTPNTKPRIEIGTSSKDEHGHAIFFVRDNGIGIEEQYHDRIFGLFNKLDAQSEETGIGLSLVKRIIEVHNGRIWVESEKDKGAAFYFSLPTSLIKE